MYICFKRNPNGSITFSGYITQTFYGYSLKECKRKYREIAQESGYTGRIIFVNLEG